MFLCSIGSFALAMVNIAGSRLVLNLKSYAAARHGDRDLTWDDPPLPPSHQITLGIPHFIASHDAEYGVASESFDLEMYSIERECQQLGTRLH